MPRKPRAPPTYFRSSEPPGRHRRRGDERLAEEPHVPAMSLPKKANFTNPSLFAIHVFHPGCALAQSRHQAAHTPWRQPATLHMVLSSPNLHAFVRP